MMRLKLMTLGAVVLYTLSIGLGLVWWFIGWQTGALAHIPSVGLVILLGLGTFQVVGWVVVFLLLRRSLRSSLHGADGIALGLSAGLLFANLVWCITPVLGAPLIFLIIVVGLVWPYLLRKRNSVPAH
jgi:hypothetical protein